MKKYVSCAVLILLCLVCAMVFYVNASDLWQNGTPPTDTNLNSTTDTGSDDNGLTNDSFVPNDTILSGAIYGEYLTSSSLRI